MTAPQDPFASPGGEPAGQAPQAEPPPWQGAPQPGYGTPPPSHGAPQFGMPRPPAGNRNGFGVAALVLGVLSLITWFLFVGGLFGVIAVVLGAIGRGRAKRGEANNGGMALAGLIMGAVGVLLTILVIVGVAALWNSEEFSTVRECVQEAGSDQAAIDACAEQFEGDLQ